MTPADELRRQVEHLTAQLQRAQDRAERAERQLERRRDAPGPLQLDPAARYDALGRKQPQQLHFLAFARGIPGFAAQFGREVPAEFVTKGHDGVRVACPCGEKPLLVPLRLVTCACDRIFVYTGDATFVARAVTESDDQSSS